jgi:hypothetical protein
MDFMFNIKNITHSKGCAIAQHRPQMMQMLGSMMLVAILWTCCSEVILAQTRRSQPAPRRTTAPMRAPLRPSPTSASALSLRQTDDEAIRLLKLGNTYREARNYDLAQKYINQGLEMATRSGNKYWQATGYEYLGLTYRDMGDRPAALSALQRASDLFAEIIKTRTPRSSRNSTQMLLDNMMRDDAARLQPMPTPLPNSQPMPNRTIPPPPASSTLRPRDIAPRPAGSLQAERDLNAQLTARLAALEARIRGLDSVASAPLPSSLNNPSPGAGSPRSLQVPPPTSSNPPGAIARTMPPRTSGDKPQGEFAPYQADKKPVPTQTRPAPTPKPDTARPPSLPFFTLQIGVGTGYALNRPLMAIPPADATILPTEFTGLSPDFSFPLLSISGDFFLSPQFSLGLMYAYYPGPNTEVILQNVTVNGTRRDTTTLATTVYTNYHFVTLRPSYHFVRNQTLDVYAGLALGSMLNFQPLRLYAGLLAGVQYNFTRQVGAFLELSGGGHFTGTTSLGRPTDVGTIVSFDPGIINIGAYGRIGLAINF